MKRKLWPEHVAAYEEALRKTSTKEAPWYVIPANHKRFRNLAISQIIDKTLSEMNMKLPQARVDLAAIQDQYRAAAKEEENKAGNKGRGRQKNKPAGKNKANAESVPASPNAGVIAGAVAAGA